MRTILDLLIFGFDDVAVAIYLAATVALFVASQLMIPKQKSENARPASLGDFSIPTADATRYVPVIFGTIKVSGPNVVWDGDLAQEAIKSRSSGGGLFSGSSKFTIGFKYRFGMQFGICRGVLDPSILQVYVGDKLAFDGELDDAPLVIDDPFFFGEFEQGGNGGLNGRLDVTDGSADQPVNAYIAAHQQAEAGTDRTPNCTGTAMAAWEQGYVGNQTSIDPWAFVVASFPNPLGLLQPFIPGGTFDAGTFVVPDEDDPALHHSTAFGPRVFLMANPAAVLCEVFLNREWGRNLPTSRINFASFNAAASTLNTEKNGVCCMIDQSVEIDGFIQEICRQIDGVVIDNPRTGQIELRLARADYDVDSALELTRATNIVSIEKFGRSTLAGTANQVRVEFVDPAQGFTLQVASEQDAANAQLQGQLDPTLGTNVATKIRYPYCYDKKLARALAARENRKYGFPLARATVRCTRALWTAQPNDVVVLTDATLGLSRLPMRVVQVTHDDSEEIVLEMIQDVFAFEASSFGTPPDTEWRGNDDSLLPFDFTLVQEAPRAVVARASDVSAGAPGAKVYAAATKKGTEIGFRIAIRDTGSGDPFVEDGSVNGSMVLATLRDDLGITDMLVPSLFIVCDTAEDQAAVLAAFKKADPADAGLNLRNLIFMGTALGGSRLEIQFTSEFCLVAGGAVAGTGLEVELVDVYRAVMDSAQFGGYVGGTSKVAILAAAGLNESFLSVPGASRDVDVKLIPFSRFGQVDEASIAEQSVAMFYRVNAPYPPGELSLNLVPQDDTLVRVDGVGVNDTFGLYVSFKRRDFRTTDEVLALTVDAGTLFPDFPAHNGTLQIVSLKIPGTPAPFLLLQSIQSGLDHTFLRNDIIIAAGEIPATLIIGVKARHVVNGDTLDSYFETGWPFTVDSDLIPLFSLGGMDQGFASNLWTVPVSTTYQFTLFTVITGGSVQLSVNGGAYSNVINSGSSSGSRALNAGDTVLVKHTSPTVGFKSHLQVTRGGGTIDEAYGVCYKS